jgi:hypothetical protein
VLLCDRDTPVGADAGIVAGRGAASFEVAPKSWEKLVFLYYFFMLGFGKLGFVAKQVIKWF